MSEEAVPGSMPTVDDVPFIHVQEHVQKVFADNLAKYSGPLQAVKTDGLSSIYMAGFPEDVRQHFDCVCCREFIRQYGGAVFVTPEGGTVSAFWQGTEAPTGFRDIFTSMKKFVEGKQITSQLFSLPATDGTWGATEAGGFNHFAIPEQTVSVTDLSSVRAATNVSKERFKNLVLMLEAFEKSAIEDAIKFLSHSEITSGPQFLPMAQYALRLKNIRSDHPNWKNLLRLEVSKAPDGWCEMQSSMVGKLIESIKSGAKFPTLKRIFLERSDKSVYQRSVAPASEGTLETATKLFKKMGLESALPRRAARLDEILPFAKWVLGEPTAPGATSETASPFDHLRLKNAKGLKRTALELPPTEVLLSKFVNEILPGAVKLEVILTHQQYVFAGTTTATNDDAGCILKWDAPEHRNPFAQYTPNTGGLFPRQLRIPLGPIEITGIFGPVSTWSGGHVHGGHDYIFASLKGVDRTGTTLGNCLFPEIVRSELHGVRSAIESYNNSRQLDNAEDASAFGMLLGKSTVVQVTLANGSIEKYVIAHVG